METKQRLIASFEKNSAEVVMVHAQERKRQTYVDIRVWTSEKAGEPGAEKPTYKGITLNVELLGDLKKAVDMAPVEIEVGEAAV